ncbi:hypothetical protein V5799_014258, partial [Amblyomma americanum]
MMDFHDSLIKFASSLRNFEKKGQEVLNAAAGKGNASALAVEGGPAVLKAGRRRRSRRRHGRGVGGGGAAAYRNDDRSFKTHAYVTAGTDDLVQKRDDESLRVIRIKILHHGREKGDIAERPHSKTTPCPVALFSSAAVRRTAVVTRGRRSTSARVRSTKKGKSPKTTRAPTSKKTSPTRSTGVPIKNCPQNDDVEVAKNNVEAQDIEQHYEESSGEDASEETASQSNDDEPAPHVDTQLPSEDDAHEYESASGSEGGTGAEADESAEYAQSATVETSQVAKGSGAKPYNLHSRGDHLRIHIVHKPSNPQADVNETFFANHSLVNKTGHDVLMVKTDDHFFVENGSKAVKVRDVDQDPVPGEVLKYVEVRRNDDQEPYFGNQDYVEEFEKRVKQVNESLQRIRNYRQPAKANRRARRDNVRFMRSLRFAPPERADMPSRKGEIQRSRVIGANSGSIRITINRRLDNEEGAQKASAARVAPIRMTEPRADGVPLRHNIHVLDSQAREVPLRTVSKRDANESSSADEPTGGDILEILVNNSRGNSEPLLNLPGKVAGHNAYASDSHPAVS